MAIVILVAAMIVVPVAVVSITGPSLWSGMRTHYANTRAKWQRAELMRTYVPAPDRTISPMRAGLAFHDLGARTGAKVDPGLRPWTRSPVAFPAFDTTLFAGARRDSWQGPSSAHILEMAHKGFSRAEMEYLAALAANPVWEDYGVLARAPRMDLAGSTFVLPFPASMSPFDLPITRFAATKEVAYANTSRAAWYLASGHPADAERVLKETISNGFRLIDDGNTLIDDLIGVVVVAIGRGALEQLYTFTNNPEAARMVVAAATFDRTHRASGGLAAPDRAALISAVTDTTEMRGLRLELVLALSMSPCTSAREVLFGPPAEVTEALATARRQLVRSPGEGALFDLEAEVIERAPAFAARSLPGLGPRLMVWTARVPAFLLRNPRISNCAALLAALSAMR